jgi:hypothetical protein
MTDQGTPAPDTAKAPGVAPTQEPTTAQPRDKYDGKTAEELAKMLRDHDDEVGRLGKELGDLRNEVGTYRQMVSQQQGFGPAAPPSGQPWPQQAPAAPSEPDKFDWDNPLRTVDTRLDRKLTEFARAMTVDQSVRMASFAEQTARQADPGLFNEVGDQVKAVMVQGIRTGTVDPRVVADPEMWKTMAWVALGQKRGFKLGSQVNPMSPTPTETPAGARAVDSEDNINLDESARDMIKGWGMPESDVLKGVKEERKKRR